MGKAPPRMYRVELYIEVPAGVSSPDQWDFDLALNADVGPSMQTPVMYKIVTPIQEGNA